MSTNKTFISELWNVETVSTGTSGTNMSQVNAAIATATSGLVKVDGTRSMTGNLDLDSNHLEKITAIKPPLPGGIIDVDGSLNMRNYNLNNIQGLNAVTGGTLKFNSNVEFGGKTIDLQDGEIINTKEPQSNNALATVKSVRKQEVIVDSMFEKMSVNKLPVANQICTASSSYTGINNILPNNAFDNNLATQWITATANSKSWLQVELPTAIHIWKIRFRPRLGAQEKTHIFTNYAFSGSLDGITYDILFDYSTYPINQIRDFEIGVTKPYKYFKIEGTGNAHFGVSEIELYEAVKLTRLYVDDSVANIFNTVPSIVPSAALTQGSIPYLSVNTQGQPILTSTSSLMLNSQGFITSQSGDVKIGSDVDFNFNTIKNLNMPTNISDAATKVYVDINTKVTPNGGVLKNTATGFEVDIDVMRVTSPLVLPTSNVSDNYPIITLTDLTANKLYYSYSAFTIPKTVTIGATKPTDLVAKKYVDDNFLSKGVYTLEKALPGIPVTAGITMMFVPSLRTCTINSNYEVLSIEDPLSKLKLTGTIHPKINFDSDKLFYIEFDGISNVLYQDHISVANIGGANGNTTTFFLIVDTKSVKNQFQFCWYELTTTGFNTTNRISVHLPWSNGIVYFDYGQTPSKGIGRVQKSYSGQTMSLINKKLIYTYRIDVNQITVYLNDTQIITKTLTAALVTGVTGRFSLGAEPLLARHSTMDFYGLYFYNRALTDDEIAAMHMYIRANFNII